MTGFDGGPVRMICHDPADGAWNMAVDQALADSAAGAGGRPAIRLYGFRSPTLSIGRFQPVADVRLDRLQEDGVPLIRRPTGGRAVLHAAEVTYAVALGRTHLRPFTKRAVYRLVGDLLSAALTDLGVTCRRAETPAGDAADPDCFAATGQYEVVGRGGKLVGSAQMVTRRGVLQHGSIPLDGSFRRVARYLAGRPAAAETGARRAGPPVSAASWLTRELGRPAAFGEVAGRLRRSLAEAAGTVRACGLDAAERRRAEALLPRFADASWTTAEAR